ncbi:hypothetical protein [uncultured Phycicoccus sp.]|uniref:hypothetical protein n=1 Tax=uncultured Phycicoccus sp. TaxID=661422 RepID=UPI0026068938|nr:hypothetical protein [uncultured Phycicoccus sp.]
MSKPNSGAQEPDGRVGWRLGWLLALIAILTLVVGAIFFLLFAALVSGPKWEILRDPRLVQLSSAELYDVTRSTLAATGLVGAGVAGGLAFRRQRTKELEHVLAVAQHRLGSDENERSKASALRQRFADAVDHLGRPEAAVRIAGVYALGQTADDWLVAGSQPGAQSCVDVLCAYLRMPEHSLSDGSVDPADVEVREAVALTLARRLSAKAKHSWSPLHYDLNGAVFTSGRFLFEESKFTGSFTMTGARVQGSAQLIFRKCRFEGGTHFGELTVGKSGFVWFENVEFVGRGGFRQLRVDGGSFGIVNSHFAPGSAARFTRMRLKSGVARFTGTRFESRVTDFTHLQLDGGWLTFREATVLAGTLNLDDAERLADREVANFERFHCTPQVTVRGNQTLLKERAPVPNRLSFEPRWIWRPM